MQNLSFIHLFLKQQSVRTVNQALPGIVRKLVASVHLDGIHRAGINAEPAEQAHSQIELREPSALIFHYPDSSVRAVHLAYAAAYAGVLINSMSSPEPGCELHPFVRVLDRYSRSVPDMKYVLQSN